MKKRDGFVSNSSSSSFIISKKYLSIDQIAKIKDNRNCGHEYADSDYWNIEEDEATLRGQTFMDNFYIDNYMEEIGVDMPKVKWES